ncbi:hypothetical protein A2755_03280 [Candidatus Wolfebacteria bacterium RIFCSPHIGHO2_01_FULL_48_22]|uniref:HicB-like antitoxin of toxin-antitoxin system domain-containing protein n=2 Tax=Candidatus Wolfeibacteriota TaxID=1752735 RepID=A0A1F8DQ32_9BACT|nr:MAG: hypothetical protein A2755_03280 [Candidatus Wolfebacteria bacterium RIFCSPHIGHO2_01_FULL_48_22]OGM92052.1 MAG: hypothetical protein A2935_01770 [Candidatus Wolfebacteria bacterium RIFCSPLOWO2_01_FULL_47_17b]
MLTKSEQIKVKKLRNKFPQTIQAHIGRSKDGGFWAEIVTFHGCVTQAESFSELIDMINDAVRTYFGIPKKYLAYMPTYIPSLKAAQYFDAFPIQQKAEIKMRTSAVHEKAVR